MAKLSGKNLPSRYRQCLDRASAWLLKRGHYFNGYIKNIDASGENIVLEIVIQFSPKMKKGKIHILASLRDVISKQDMSCKKSNVCVTYFEVEKEKKIAYAIESIRYDTKVPPEKQHAICHAHVVDKSISKQRRPQDFDYKISEEYILKRYENARIPSAYVNLPGLLFILTADHLPNNKWKEFIDHCSTQFKEFPSLTNCSIINNIMREKSLMAYHWYNWNES